MFSYESAFRYTVTQQTEILIHIPPVSSSEFKAATADLNLYREPIQPITSARSQRSYPPGLRHGEGATEANRRFNEVNLPNVIAKEARLKQIEDSTELISRSVVPTMIKSSLKKLPPCARKVGYVHGKRRHCEGGTTEAISRSVVPTMIKSSLKRLTPCARNGG